MSIVGALRRGQRAAERLMVDQCLIRRRTGETTGPGGVITPEYEVLYGPDLEPYRGKCRLQQPTGTAQEQESGEANVLLIRFELQLPVSAVGLQADDEVLMTASVHDSDLPGREFLIRSVAHKTHAVMRRLQLEERTS